HASCAIAITAVLCADVHAFEVNNIWRITDDIGFELQAPIFNGHPYSSLLNPARASLTKARWILVQGVHAAFIECGLRMNRNHQIKFLRPHWSQGFHRIEILPRP